MNIAVRQNSVKKSLIYYFLITLSLFVCMDIAQAEKIPLVSSDRCETTIVIAPDSGVTKLAAQRLAGYLKKCCGKAPAIETASESAEKSDKQTVIIIGTAELFPEFVQMAGSDGFKNILFDGYILKTAAKDGKKFILAIAPTEKGASNAIWNLMRKIKTDYKANASVDNLDIKISPLIKGREAMIIRPWVREGLKVGSMANKLLLKYGPHFWDEEKIRNYADVLDCFGFNAVELSQTWILNEQLEALGIDYKEVQNRLRIFSEQAHKNGQLFNMMVYGSSVKDPKTDKTYARPGACFNDPYQKQVLLNEYDYQAKTYAPHVDRIVTHWSDYGGQPDCDKCTIKTALEQHNLMVEKFREINPKIQSSFSLWNVTPSIWPGYKGDDSILDAGILPKDVSLAVPGRYNDSRVKHFNEKGYKGSVWAWRFLDIEIWHGMHVHTKKIKDYFASLPADISDRIEFHTVDDVSQWLIYSNLYLAAQLMMNPQADENLLLREFTAGMFGSNNAEKMAQVYEAIEKGSCNYCPGHQPPLAQALEGAENRYKILTDAKKVLKQIKLAEGFVSVFPAAISPAEMLKEIEAELDVMITYADFQVEASKLMAYYPELESMGDAEGVKKAFEALPKVPEPQEYLWHHIYGRYETDHKSLKKELGL